MAVALYDSSHAGGGLIMAISVYTGLQGSGKSYEVVSEVIVPAIAQGRRVVTNVDGISDELIREYAAQKYKVDFEKLGSVVHVTNGDVFETKFFPYYDSKKESHTDTVVQPGDLVCIDEAWRFWPATGAKIPMAFY
jgi:zona occludens toxin